MNRIINPKEPIKIRYKTLSKGNKSIYLDCYYKGKRWYEFLKIYLVPERTKNDKLYNKESLQKAIKIKSKRINELFNEANKFSKIRNNDDLLLIDLCSQIKDSKKTVNTQKVYKILINYLSKFNPNVQINQVDSEFCNKFILFLNNKVNLSPNTINFFAFLLKACLNLALKRGIIENNPFSKVDYNLLPKKNDREINYLNIDEVSKLINTNCKNENIKKAFLFSCFCGLRYSDIITLNYNEIIFENHKYFISKVMLKTQKIVKIPLSTKALFYISIEKIQTNENVFNLPSICTIERVLKDWQQKANIQKKITFHVSRHTFATMYLTLGGDIMVISKLLGHTNLKTTQIYAKVIDQKKIDTIDLVEKISLF